MKNNFIIRLILLAVITISLHSCIRDSMDSPENSLKLHPLEYAKNYVQGKTMVSGKNLQWENARIYENKNDVVLISVPIKNEAKNIIEELTFRIDNNKMTGHFWKFKSNNNFSSEDYKLSAHEIMKKMVGTVSYTALEGSMKYEYNIIRGEIINNLSSKNGPGDINNPTCNACHMAEIEPVIITPTPPWTPPTIPPIPPIIVFPPPTPQDDPCTKAAEGSSKATDLAKNSKFSNAKQGILDAYAQNGGENGVAFGSNSQGGSLESTGVQPLGQNSGTINNPYPFPFADAHNHPDNSPPSAGDVYSMMFYHNQYNSFQIRYIILPNGTVYALIITNANAFADFLQQYPPSQVPGFNPNFPDSLLQEYQNLTFDMSQESALSFMLDKYNTGIALTKMDGNGNFKKKNITKNPNGTYNYSTCP